MRSPYRDAPRATAPTPDVRVRWIDRDPPLAPVAVAGFGDVARALARRLLRMDDDALGALRGVAGEGLVVVSGPTLPWVDGARYAGRDPEAPTLLVPTSLRPDVPAALFEKALRARVQAAGPTLVVPRGDGLAVVSLAEALPVSRAQLAAWCAP